MILIPPDHYVLLVTVSIFSLLIERGNGGTAPSGSTYEVTFLSANLDYANKTFLGPGGYFQISRKSRRGSPGLNVFLPIIRDLPTTLIMKHVLLRKVSNKWVESFVTVDRPICEVVESGMSIEKEFFGAGGINFPQKCPVTKGNYTMTDFKMSGNNLPTIFPDVELRMKSTYAIGTGSVMKGSFDLKAARKSYGGNPKKDRH